jgi:hypothetical protein
VRKDHKETLEDEDEGKDINQEGVNENRPLVE